MDVRECFPPFEEPRESGYSNTRRRPRHRRREARGYQIQKYPDLGINRHAGTSVMAKNFPYGEDFSPYDEHKCYGIMKTGPQDTRRGIPGEVGDAAGP